MAHPPQEEALGAQSTVQQKIAHLAAKPEVRVALTWLRAQEPQFARWQMELACIPAPPFGEAARADWFYKRLVEMDLDEVLIDEVGNVFGTRPGPANTHVALSAHLDTVFAAGTPLNVRQQGSRLHGPGVSDNGAGLTALLAVAAAMQECKVSHSLPVLFVGNVGEEGEGDLRGMRHIFAKSKYRDSIVANVVLDGAGADTIVAEALGSIRFEVIVRGPGGHSWSDFGAPNPIVALSKAVSTFVKTPIPSSPKTTFNVGVVRGGTSVNSIPESASIRVDIRSTSPVEMQRLEHALRAAINLAVSEESRESAARTGPNKRQHGLSSEVVVIGDRPAGELKADARILQVIRAVDAHLGNVAQVQRASTDANIPLSLGREAIAIGGGGAGGGAHTLREWFDCTGRELGLRRVLLTVLALAGAAE